MELGDRLAEANELLSQHPLAAVRLAGWRHDEEAADFEVFHLDWPKIVFGKLVFRVVTYLQVPARTQWGYRIRTAREAVLPSRGDADSADVVFELYTEDGAEPSAFVVAEALAVERLSV